MPASTSCSSSVDSFPTRSTSSIRSMDRICDTFATESWGKPVESAVSKTFP